jgi:hypothetical protein
MARLFKAWLDLYRRWRLVEEKTPASPAKRRVSESDTMRQALEREERLIADYRRLGRLSLAKDRESSARALRSRLALLDS